MLSHVLKEVFLAPPRKQAHRYATEVPQVIGCQHRYLMSIVLALAHLPHPKTVAQTHPPFRQRQLHFLAADQTNFPHAEFLLRPLTLRELVIGDYRNSFLPPALEKLRG